ncbi:MAG: hypothetical protein H3C36_05040 [Chitinophagaceae bacterium]|nr:hypothetical protein [Chitinophagaceae bacterium]MCZ2396637.1 hypothetical protein [Chitinophagales bacterium]
MKGDTFSAGRNTMTIYYDRGRVAGKDKNMETRVLGSGGGGGAYQGTGATASVHITSTTIIHDKIYLQKEDGKERAVELTNWDVACREGHDMVVAWIIPEGKESGDYTAIKNITTGIEMYDNEVIKGLGNQHLIKKGILRFLVAVVLWVILYNMGGGTLVGLGVVAYFVYEIFMNAQNKQAAAVIKKNLKTLMNTQN